MPISPISVAEFKAHGRIPFDDDDLYIADLLEDATEAVEKATGRVLMSREMTYLLDGFPGFAIELPYRPLVSVESITYVDASGETQTVDASAYVLGTKRGLVYPLRGWPSTRVQPEAVTVTYVAGYGDAADVPGTLKRAVYFLAALWYAQREPLSNTSVAEIPFSLKALLNLDKVHRL